jgi:acyl-CoA reductase-like NAD-dependent aldehyde dehydrogenase
MKFYLYIDGEFCEASDGRRFDTINPATEEVWASVPEAGEADVDRAVEAATRAGRSGPWARMSAVERGRLLYRLGDLLKEKSRAFGEIETRDTGKIIRETSSQAAYMAGYYHYYAGLADKIEGAVVPTATDDLLAITTREPIGVVAAVVPWNSQMLLSAAKIAPALAAGNTVVVKASEDGPTPLLKFAELVHEAGFPPGVVNVVAGFGERCGRALTAHPDVARVAFTGGPVAAREVIRNTAENFAVTSLELGGKSPLIVFEDADLDNATNGILAGIFGASGQSCVAGSRLLVHEAIRDALLERLASRAAQIRIGDPMSAETEMGPLCTRRQRDGVERAIAETLEAGGELICGGRRPGGFERGFYFEPTILCTEGEAMASYERELFGPVLSLRSFRDEDEAVHLANDNAYGLAGGAFTRDLGRGIRVGRRIRSGISWINTWRVVSPAAPFGGFKLSGYGREGGQDVIYDYTRTKTLWINASEVPLADPFRMQLK